MITLEDVTDLDNGVKFISNPFYISYQLPVIGDIDAVEIYNLWGVRFRAINFANNDFIRFKIFDPYNLFGYGAGACVKYYEEMWVSLLNTLCKCFTPDGAPGELVETLVLSLCLYPTDPTGDDIYTWGDFVLTEK